MHGQLCQAPQILSDGRKGELELGSAWPAQAKPAKAQDALEVREQHLNLFAVSPCLRISLARSDGAGGIAGFFIEAAQNFPVRRLRATLWLQGTAAAIVDAGAIGQLIVVVEAARCCQIAAGGTDVAIAAS